MPRTSRGRTLFRLFGLPVRANASWLFLVALVMLSLAQGYFPSRLGPAAPWQLNWGLAVLGTVGLFASLIVHEMAHSLVARATGISVLGITLFVFGGVSELKDEPPTAGAEFFMAVVGPLSSVIIGVLLGVLWFAALLMDWAPPLRVLLGYLSFINFILAAFNSLPAFPLDGGRVLRSILWGITGDLRTATQVAANVGSLFAFALMFGGAMLAFTVPGAIIPGVWLMIIGFFVRQAAMGSLQAVIMREQLAGDKVSRFMTADVVTVPPGLSVQQFVDDYVFRHRFAYYPVVDGYGRLVGLLSARAPREVDRARWPFTRVEDVMRQADKSVVLDPETDAAEALSVLRQGDVQRAVVVRDGRPVGIVSLRDLLQFLALKLDLEPRGRAPR